ncbi:hypothetical protein VOLCADRAFT_108313 [Volvox carteri f. nagariensis]|uniref:Uncharacterized protein n=1 Tax=Volvox carteri f. nagariensis TaxID=3068 RepID=D8UJE3_VOLCA|nr:uncharacterized protein VOLCADRAFT_108313 [Volvox carteri f. nagariensis]EFJ40157.1 hypothetical protein VOLCADRAFT_108313 [Volvox carteri f. nagariensis]|eukprot:XP_002958767.1 hypothetical protein VOLCADRAFT_108313 [Volvox carteri f. nagariensis]
MAYDDTGHIAYSYVAYVRLPLCTRSGHCRTGWDFPGTETLTFVITPPNTYGDFLPSLSANPAGPGPGSAASQRLTGHVRALSASRERTSTGSSYASKRLSGPVMPTSMQSPPSSLPSPPTGDLPGTGTGSGTGPGTGQHNSKLPPLSHGYGSNSPRRATGTPSTAASQSHPSHGDRQPHGTAQGEKQSGPLVEAIQPLIQHPSMLPGPTPASHPYQHKRKPPSAFMRNNPMLQQLEMGAAGAAHQHTQTQQQHHLRSASAGSTRPQLGPLFDSPRYGGAGGSDGSGAEGAYGGLPNELQAQQFAQEVMAAAQAAMAQGKLHQAWGGEEDGGAAGTAFVSAAPWGVSSVSDLEALDSILDQLVVVDARMRKALLKGPLISFETVVPEHVMYPAGAATRQQQQQEEERDRTFITAVKGVADEDVAAAAAGQEEGAGGGGAAAEQSGSTRGLGLPPPPPSPAEREASSLGGAFSPAAAPSVSASAPVSTRQTTRPAEDYLADSSLFPASIPNPGMHPTFTRAYLASKMAVKPQHLPPPPPATAEHLLRSRPPPFIAAPSYDQLCSQIRDVQRQYTCGSSRPAGQGGGPPGGTGSGGGTAAMGGAGFTAAIAAGLPVVPPSAHQYIAGLDGPTLDEVVAHQELPISLERVRPTFVALKQKARSVVRSVT